MAAIISNTRPGSIARELGLKKGDEIILLNGVRLRDVIDYEFLSSDEQVTLLARTGRGLEEFDIEKDEGESLGIDFADALFDKVRTCGANCVFCFERQLPEGLRPSLKMRDDDYRLSFLYGCYVTLGNLREEDTDRIVSQRLSPLYVSVHATDHALRQRLIGKKLPDIMEQLRYFISSGISFHCQAVICPGLNDGAYLQKTIEDLSGLHPGAISLALVPVGLTEHREGLPHIDPVTREDACRVIDMAEGYAARFRETLGTSFVWCADEFYLKAGRPLPPGDFYEDYAQYENGIGLVRDFLDNADKGIRALDRLDLRGKTVGLVTGKSFAGILKGLDLGKNRSSFRIIDPENTLFGKTVTVTGLLSGRVIAARLQGCDLAVIPSVCLSDDGVFLDDLTPEDVERLSGVPVIITRPYLAEMARQIKKHFDSARKQ
ncbi:MAG: DUF512 domain-containing protein [Abditibacteriota bacterium]|nr:DUF512 domain-containing protein [Abditibacteriota bacterium]